MSANNGEELNEGVVSTPTKDSSSPTASGSIRQTPQQDPQPPKLSSSLDKNNPTKASQPPTKGAAAAASTTGASTKPVAATPPAKKEPEPPPFEKGLVEGIKNKFGDAVKVLFIKPLRMKIQVDPQNIVGVASFLRDSIGFDHAESVAGTDYPKDNQIEVIYHLGSYSREDLAPHILWLTTRTNRDDARLPTLINVYKSVEYHERECYEMLGVYFEGHPRNERFLLPEDWADIPPLRRDFRIKGR
ncbi:MAG: NADH-quinone oxidoreductase subunit C [Nitrososphaera sp.]